ncbi:MAG: VWA domain-containing protein [Planctomycetes bacterium]|nr:VWA domain-containing protein [Planctomycetota bacterium]
MFANPLGFLALLAIPAIVALHLFRRRFRPRVVSALFLWADEDRTPVAGRKRDRLRASTSLWLEVLAAALLALLLAGPRGCQGARGEHLVVALDGSASMEARGADGRTARAEAAELVAERIRALPRGSRVSIVASGPRPRTVAGPAAFPEEAQAALAGWHPSASRHDVAPAIALAQQLAGAGRVLFVTDRHAPDEAPPGVEVAAVGEPLDNWAIAGATRSVERGESGRRERVFVTVASYASAQRTRHVRLLDDAGREIAPARPVVLAPGAREHLAFDLPAAAGPIEVRLDSDALAIDDAAFLAPRPARVVGVATTLEDAARAELLLDGPGAPLARLLALVDEAVLAPEPGSAHLVLGRAPAGGAAWSLVLAPDPGAGSRQEFIGPFLFERRHPLLEGTTLEGLVWSADPGLELSGTPLVAAGNRALLAEERDGPRRIFRLNLDPARSSLQRSPDWPILLTNLLEERRRELPGAVATNLVAGAPLAWRGVLGSDDDGAPFVLRGPRGRREHPPRDTLVFDEVDEPGFHRLERHGAQLAIVGVSFQDASESDLRARSSGTRTVEEGAAARAEGPSQLELILLLAIVALALIDWTVLAFAGRSRA